MPSPFPGMDPYLEDPESWGDVHHWLITAVAEQLQPQLVPLGYRAAVERRVWLEEPERAIYPDVAVLRTRPVEPGGAEGLLVADPPTRLRREKVEVRESYIQIYYREGRKLVSGVEVVSPTNKADSQGRALYLKKRSEMVATGVSLVEVDLLRSGKPVVALPDHVLSRLRKIGYVVNVVRAGAEDFEFYPVLLRERLPRVGVPLRAGERDVVLDLQAVVARAYEAGAFATEIDYNRPPVPRLAGDDARWADALLTERGLRTRTT